MSETIITKDLLDKMVRLRNQAEYYNLVGAELLREMIASEMAQVCNGIGAEWMPEEMRKCLDDLAPDMQAPAAIHDALFAFLQGGRDEFEWANKTLKTNAYAIAEAKYAWWELFSRYRTKAEGRLARKVCDEYGATAWVQAKEDAASAFSPDRLKHLQKVAQEIWEKHK